MDCGNQHLLSASDYTPGPTLDQPIGCDARLMIGANYWNSVAGWQMIVASGSPVITWRETVDPADQGWGGLTWPDHSIWINPSLRDHLPTIAHEVGHALGFGHIEYDARITGGAMIGKVDNPAHDRVLLASAGYRVVEPVLSDRERRWMEREARRAERRRRREERRNR